MAFVRFDVPESSRVVLQQEGNRPLKDTTVRKEQGKAQSWKTNQNKQVWESGETMIWSQIILYQFCMLLINSWKVFHEKFLFSFISGIEVALLPHKELHFLSWHMLEVFLHWHRKLFFFFLVKHFTFMFPLQTEFKL